jgi:hypothetical protein
VTVGLSKLPFDGAFRPSWAPTTRQFTGAIPFRWEGAPNGPFRGDVKFRGVKDLEHSTLCRAFGLDPIRFYFDIPSSMRGVGTNTNHARSRRTVQAGFVFMHGHSAPVAKLTIATEGDRFSDSDPMSQRDFENLERA